MSFFFEGRGGGGKAKRGRKKKPERKNSPLFSPKLFSPPHHTHYYLGVSGVAHKSWGKGYEHHAIAVRVMAAAMMVLSIFMAGYAAHMFKVRGDMLMRKADGPYDSRVLPVLLGCMLVVALTIVFGGSVAELAGWAG